MLLLIFDLEILGFRFQLEEKQKSRVIENLDCCGIGVADYILAIVIFVVDHHMLPTNIHIYPYDALAQFLV